MGMTCTNLWSSCASARVARYWAGIGAAIAVGTIALLAAL